MEKIKSFEVNHIGLAEGLYVSRMDTMPSLSVTTFDLRMTKPNVEPAMTMSAMHTIEHLGATFLRNNQRIGRSVIYFGPMGCGTGFYLVLSGEWSCDRIYPYICDMCEFILGFSGAIPGVSRRECGNCAAHDINMAKYYIDNYYRELTQVYRTEYPQ